MSVLPDWIYDPRTDYLRTPSMMTQPTEKQYAPNAKRVIATTAKSHIVVQDIHGVETIIGVVVKLGKRQFRNDNTGRIYRSLNEAAQSVTLGQTVKAVTKTAKCVLSLCDGASEQSSRVGMPVVKG